MTACLILTMDSSLPLSRRIVSAAVPYWDSAAALASVRAHTADLDEVTLWWYETAATGEVINQPFAPDDTETIRILRARGLRVLGTVVSTVNGRWDATVVRRILADPTSRRFHAKAVLRFVLDRGLDGVQLDYEDLSESDRAAFSSFVADLARTLHQHKLLLSVTVHPKADDQGYGPRNLAQDYLVLGRWADEVVVMAYDWHWPGGPSGPIAPRPWVDRVLAYSESQMPANKILLGLGVFGYDWSGTGTDILQWRDAEERRRRVGAEIERDPDSGCPHLSYHSEGDLHEVWFEDGYSVQQKVDLARRYGVAGVAVWRLGGEEPQLWRVLGLQWSTPLADG